MNIETRTPYIKIECYHTYNDVGTNVIFLPFMYKSFTPTNGPSVGAYLTSYSFERSINRDRGSFSFTVKEDAATKKMLFSDQVRPLDVIKIYEGNENKLVFIGVVNSHSFSASKGGVAKSTTVSGQSCECLFDMFNISLDVTAMSFTGTIKEATALQKELLSLLSDTSKNPKIVDIMDILWQEFVSVAQDVPGVTATIIKDIIYWLYDTRPGTKKVTKKVIKSDIVLNPKSWKSGNKTHYNNDYVLANPSKFSSNDCEYSAKALGYASYSEYLANNATEAVVLEVPTDKMLDFRSIVIDQKDLEFQYPISSNFITGDNLTFFTWLENLLPSNVYEIYGTIKDNKPRLVIREVPFDQDKFDKLIKDNDNNIKAINLISYTFTRTNQNVYTAFLPYLVGSQQSPEFYQKVYANINGYSNAYNSKMASIYGYKPLVTNFIGYSCSIKSNNSNTQPETKDVQSVNTITEKMKNLAKRMNDWYGNLEKMYQGQVELVNTDISTSDESVYKTLMNKMPMAGETIKFPQGYTFYITKENRKWQYESGATISYAIERGGQYVNGVFNPIKGMSAYLSELTENTANKDDSMVYPVMR